MAVTDHSQHIASAPELRRVGVLVVGDIIAFNIITAIGLGSHGELSSLSALPTVVEVAAPFALGWFVIAPFVGAFKSEVASRPSRMLTRTAIAWLIALPIGLLLWSLLRQKQIQTPFAIVTFITNLIALAGWRGTYAWLASRRRG